MSLYKELKQLTDDIKSGKLDIPSYEGFKPIRYSECTILEISSSDPTEYQRFGCNIYVQYKNNPTLNLWCKPYNDVPIIVTERLEHSQIFKDLTKDGYVAASSDEVLVILEEFNRKEEEVLAVYNKLYTAKDFCAKFINLVEETNYTKYKQFVEEEYDKMHNHETD